MTASTTPMQLPQTKAVSWTRVDVLALVVLVAGALALYLPTRHFDFIEFDDHLYVFRNAHVVQGLTAANLRWAMTAIVVGNWHPLTLLTELLIVTLAGPNAGAFHLTNALLHTTNVLLLYAFFRNSTGRVWASFFVAGLWGFHPLRIESVAWVSELKDVLCGTLWLACMLVYLSYNRHRTLGGYALVFALQALALAAKPMAATLPGALLLLDVWPLAAKQLAPVNVRAWTVRILEKLPLVALCVTDILYAVHTQKEYEGPGSAEFPMALRVKNALVSYVFYLRDIFLPRHLVVYYPHPAILDQTIGAVSAVLAALLLLLITAAVLLRFRVRPYLAVGWFWYVGTMIPVLGLVRIGDAARADRYTYLPSIGITFALVWWVSDRAAVRRNWIIATRALGVIALASLAIASSLLIRNWKNTQTLFDYVRSVQPGNPMARVVYIQELLTAGRTDQAMETARSTIAIAPKSASAHAAYSVALQQAGQLTESAHELVNALDLTPANDDYWDGLGQLRVLQARQAALNHDPAENQFRQKAVNDFRDALHYNPDSVDAMEHLATELAALGRLDEAIAVWKQLTQLVPAYSQAQGDLAVALRLENDLPGAVEHFRAALAAGSKNPSWESELAYLVATNPQATPADVQPLVSIAKDACDQTHNTNAGALDAYAACLARVGRFDDAVVAAKQGIDQANAANTPLVAAGIKKRLAKYQLGLPWVAGD